MGQMLMSTQLGERNTPQLGSCPKLSSVVRCVGLEICSCLTRTGLLCQQERGLKKQRESKRSSELGLV